MRRLGAADACYGAALLTLPLVGVGTIHAALGLDVGTGLQPAYLLLALAWLWRLADLLAPGASGRRHRLRADPAWSRLVIWGPVAAAAVLVSALGLMLAPAPLLPGEAWPRFLRQVAQLVVMAAFLVYPALWTRGARRWRWTLRLIAWATLVELGYAGLLAVHQLVDLPLVAGLDRLATSNPAILAGSDRLYLGGYTTLPRLRGTMCEPLYLGSYLLAVIPLLSLRDRRWLPWLAALALLLTWSRGAWAGVLAGLALWWILRRRARLPGPPRRAWSVAAAVVAVGLLLATVVGGAEALLWPVQRVAQTLDAGDWSNLTRYYSFQAAWRCFLASPLVGVGWGQFSYHFYALVDLPGLESQFTWPVVNSVPLLVLAETGLVGFSVLVAAVAAVARATWRTLAETREPARAARLAALAAGGGGMSLQLLFFSQYNLPHLWVVPGLWLAALAEEVRRS